MSESETDRACMTRVCAGDAQALEELYDRHASLLYGLVVRIVGRSQDAEEVLQDTWLQVWRNATSWDPARGPVAAWLVTLARSRAIDRFRSVASRLRRSGAASPSPGRPSLASVLDADRKSASSGSKSRQRKSTNDCRGGPNQAVPRLASVVMSGQASGAAMFSGRRLRSEPLTRIRNE